MVFRSLSITRFLMCVTRMQTHTNKTINQEPILLGIKPALEAVFPDENSRPSIRAWNEWRAKGYYGHVKIGKRVFINPVDARRALEARFTIEASR